MKLNFYTKNKVEFIYKKTCFLLDNQIDSYHNLKIYNNDSKKNLVIYDILDGTRTSLPRKNTPIQNELQVTYYLISFIHVLLTLGVKSCVFLIHTSYNRQRGINELRRIGDIIKKSYGPLIQFFKNNLIHCHCLYPKNYEFADLLENFENETKNGIFNSYFLFDYNEEWQKTVEGERLIELLPEINVNIRHTKFQPTGGWIPDKMKKCAFLYSQNGTVFSNWNPRELIVLSTLALLAKILNEGESFNKSYTSFDEIQNRYTKREMKLFEKKIYLNKKPKKLSILGSPIGPYIIYY